MHLQYKTNTSKSIVLLFFTTLVFVSAAAQNVIISGRMLDKMEEPLIGVAINWSDNRP